MPSRVPETGAAAVGGVAGARATGVAGLWLKRSRARTGLLAAAAAIAVLVSYLGVSIIGLALLSAAPAVHTTLRDGAPQTIGVQAEAPLAVDPAAQNAAARTKIASLFPGLHLHVAGLAETSPIPLAAAQAAKAGASSVVLMLDGAAVRAGIRTVSGTWPTVDTTSGPAGAPAPVAVQADAARRLGVSVGDAITVPSTNGAVTLRVAATWRVRDAAAPLWFGDQRVATGRAADALGPFIVSAEVLGRFDTTPYAAWVVTPDAGRTAPGDVPLIADGFDRMAGAMSADGAITDAQVSVAGDGGQTARSMQQSMAALAAVLPLPVAILAVGSVLALVLLARLTADTRAMETTLLRARGANGALLVRAAAVESALLGVIGAAVGGALAAMTLSLIDGGLPSASVLLIPPAVVALCVIVVHTTVVFGTVRAALGAVRDAGRGRTAASAGLTALVVLAAAFALWRFLQYTRANGALDAAGIAAPALALLAVALLGLVAFAPLTRAVDAAASRSQRIGITLPARQIGRGLGFFTAPAALVILAVAASLLGAGYYGTWSALNGSAAQAVNAADVRVQTALAAPLRGPGDSVGASGYGAIPGISLAVPALRADAQIGGDTQLTAVAAPVGRLAALEGSNASLLGVTGLSRALVAPAVAGEVALPKGSTTLTATMEVASDGPASTATVAVTLWLCDDEGELVPLTTDALPVAAHVTTPALAVPKTAGRWRVVAIDATFAGGGVADNDTWHLTSLAAAHSDGAAAPVSLVGATGWRVVSDPFSTPPGVTAGTGIGLTAPALNTTEPVTVRLMPGAAGRTGIAVTADFAQANGLRTGDRVTIDGGWWSVDSTIAATVALVPGERSPNAGLFDLGSLQRAVLRTTAAPPAANQVWASAPDPARVVKAVQNHAGAAATVTVADTAFVERFVTSAFIGLALGCAGCIALAIIALASATAALSRRRRAEVAVFRALGFTARQQAGSRSSELWAIVAVAAVIGAIAGIAVMVLVAPGLARLTVVTAPAALPLSIVVDAVTAALALVLLGAAVTAVILTYRAAVTRQAHDSEYREETR